MFTSKVSFVIGLNAGGVPYPESGAIKIVTEELAVHGIDGFSVSRGLGFWRGEPEDTLTVSVLVDDDTNFPVYAERVAQVFAVRLDQECVLWAVEPLPLNGGLAYAAHNDNFSVTKVAAVAA